MKLADIITQNAVFTDLTPNSKKQLIQTLAQKAQTLFNMQQEEVFDTLMKREKLGSTAVGDGVAIPHGKIKQQEKISGIFAKLNKPIEFEAIDEKQVDIVFLLLAPQNDSSEHLKALSKIARLFRDKNYLQKLRNCQDAHAIYNLLIES